jgi:hypothetical protein
MLFDIVTGAAVQWLRDALGIIASAHETEGLAESLESNDGVYFKPMSSACPYWFRRSPRRPRSAPRIWAAGTRMWTLEQLRSGWREKHRYEPA